MTMSPLLPEGVEIEHLLDRLRYFSWGAADILIAYSRGEQPPHGFPKALDVEYGGEGPVSAADLAVNKWLLDGLESSFPETDWKLISEETAQWNEVQEEARGQDWVWILDPLDGTKDFLQLTGEYAVHLALVKNKEPVLGVVLIPEAEELWFGIIGQGAWCENREAIKRPVSFSQRRSIKDLVLVSSRNHRDLRLVKLIENLEFSSSKTVGSVGCKVASILRGDADIYISLSGKTAPKDWDMAAPHAVLKAANGKFTHANGSPLIYNNTKFEQRGCLIASHGFNHELLCEKIMEIIIQIDPDFLV